MCSNHSFGEDKLILIGHSFGGLLIKSLVVEVGKLRLVATKNDFERRKDELH
jgi:triacylglycerol esterase/lipase EstA (alpha/beta hydrolase family)